MITEDFGKSLVNTFNDPYVHKVHLLFNEWWQEASQKAKDSYVRIINQDPHFAEFASGALYTQPIDLDAAGALPLGTVGRSYHDWIIDNDLIAAIITNYEALHDSLVEAGKLDGMPDEMKHAVLRSYQTHDFQHVITGYDASPYGELALQAFGLAQLQFPYFAMWLSVTTTRMTYINPNSITSAMDAISAGWTLGRNVANIQCEKWETMLDQPLADVRARYGLTGSPSLRVAQAD